MHDGQRFDVIFGVKGGTVNLAVIGCGAIIEAAHHLEDSGMPVREIHILEPALTISSAALDTILTLTDEQASAWLRVLMQAAESLAPASQCPFVFA